MAVKGLFSGPTPQDIRQLMARENEARIVQAQKMGSAGGQPIAGNMAAASQRMRNAFNTMTGGLATAMGRGQQDPRLARAVKRDTDRREILQILEGYRTNDGVIDEREMKQGYALLLSKGYLTEAKEFRAMVETMARKTSGNNRAKSGPVGVGTPVTIKTQEQANKATKETGQKVNIGDTVAQINHYDSTLDKYVPEYVAYIGDPAQKSKMGTKGRLTELKGSQEIKGTQIRKTEKYKQELQRDTNKLKQLLNIKEDAAKELASINLKDRSGIINSGLTAAEDLPKLRALVDLAKLRKEGKTGGELEASFRRLGRSFGFENRAFADFRVGSQNLMIENLKRIFGPKATDKDMEELQKAFANENQTYEGNVSILEALLKKYEKEIDNTEFMRNNPLASKADLFDYVRTGRNVPTEIAINLIKEKRAELKNNPEEWKKITAQFRNTFGNLALKKALKNRD